MADVRHILITGSVGIGKSTLIRKLLRQLGKPVYGFITLKMAPQGSDRWPFYIFPAAQPEDARSCTEENLLGIRGAECTVHPEVFDRLGGQYIREAKPDGVILMDELGFMEADAKDFQQAVLEALHGEIPVIASVKSKPGVPFLEAVRACENTVIYTVTKENRDTLAEEIVQNEALFRSAE